MHRWIFKRQTYPLTDFGKLQLKGLQAQANIFKINAN